MVTFCSLFIFFIIFEKELLAYHNHLIRMLLARLYFASSALASSKLFLMAFGRMVLILIPMRGLVSILLAAVIRASRMEGLGT